MNVTAELRQRLRAAVNRDRLVRTAVALIEVPSPTGDGFAGGSHPVSEFRLGKATSP